MRNSNGNDNGNGHHNGHGHHPRRQTRKQQQKSLEIEVRRSNVFGLHTKQLNQMEIAKELGISQTTVSDDLRHIKQQSNDTIVEMPDNMSFEYHKYIKTNDEIQKEYWKVINFEIDLTDNTIDPALIMSANINNKNKIAALTALQEANDRRMELFTGGSKSTHDHEGLTIRDHAYHIKQDMKSVEQLQKEESERLMRDYKIGGIIR